MHPSVTRSAPRALAPLLALLVLPAPRAAEAEEPPRAEAPSKPAEQPAAPASNAPEPPREETWVDTGHSFIEQRIFAPILRLDRFFSDEREFEAERERSFLRWRSEVRFASDASRPAFTTGVNATLRLPGLNMRLRRLRVVIAGETRDAVNALFPEEPGGPGETSPEEDAAARGGDAGLRFYLWNTLSSHADLGGGFLLQLPPGVYGRIRFRVAFPVSSLFLTRLALIPFWRSDVKFGTTVSGELDRPVARWVLLRLSGNGSVSQGSDGIEWWSELAAVVALPPRSAAQIGVTVNGATARFAVAPDGATGSARAWRVPAPERTRAYTRLRTDVYRRWLFVELEPEVAWPWTPEKGRYSAWGLTLRAEVQFQGKEAPQLAPPPPPPKPKDRAS